MSSAIVFAKSLVENLPEGIGRHLAGVPFSWRLGRAYTETAQRLEAYQQEAPFDRVSRLRELIIFAEKHIPFYQKLYRQHGFSSRDFRTMEDWGRVPIVTKEDLQCTSLEDRSGDLSQSFKVNTGGTSGRPLEFFLDKNAFAREWAHMHFIWKSRGYQQKHLKLTFRGKYFDPKRSLRYNAVHNEFIVNANSPMEQVVEAVLGLPRKSVVRWIHGYPSLVAEFAHALNKRSPSQASLFRESLLGVLLGSEYPAPVYRSVIENVLSKNTVSWYGHSEMAVLAVEKQLGVYETLPTYGYAEAVPDGDSGSHRLVCSSYFNFAHPFIRYDTGDRIAPVAQTRGALSFRIHEGRVGDFILDRKGKKLSLTAILFGRHHEAFGSLRHLQIRDDGHGKIALLLTPQVRECNREHLIRGFDLSDLDIDLHFELIDSPIRTASGKILLKLPSV